MCEWSTSDIVALPINVDSSKKVRSVSLDRCIALVIPRLWDAGYETLGCCCGHNKSSPSVILAGGHSQAEIDEASEFLYRIDGRNWEIMQWRLMTVGCSSGK